MSAIAEYYKKEKDYLARVAELDQVTQQRDSVRAHFEGLRKERLDMFMSGFSTITNKLKEMYQMITLGGDAELELVDRLNPFSEGIVFSVSIAMLTACVLHLPISISIVVLSTPCVANQFCCHFP